MTRRELEKRLAEVEVNDPVMAARLRLELASLERDEAQEVRTDPDVVVEKRPASRGARRVTSG